MKKPLIALTLDHETKKRYSKFPWYAIRKNYLHSIEKYGGIPIPLYHSSKNIDEIYNFRKRHKKIILKPLYGNGGNEVFYLGENDRNFSSLLDISWIRYFLFKIFIKGDFFIE